MRLLALLAVSLIVASSPGVTWQPETGQLETAPRWIPQSSGVTVRLRGVSAVSTTVGWASGAQGTVLKTVDGGHTWQRLMVPDAAALDFRDIDAFDDQTAYVLSIGPGEASRIYKTVDGGARWTQQFVNHDPKAFFDGIAFWDAERGLAVSDSVDGRFVVIRTENGGRTWTPVPAEALPDALPGEGAFAASGTSVAVSGREHAWIGTGASSAARVLQSRDAGRTWTVAPTPLPSGPSAGIFSIAFRDASHGIIVGGDYEKEGEARDNVAVTRDGGVTWTPVPAPAVSGFRSAVAYVPGADRPAWVAAGPSGSDVSIDDGERWTAVGPLGYHALALARGAIGWGVGEAGAIGRLEWSPGARLAAPQTQEDDYTSYELLAPERQQFRILYDVTATTRGARYFFNPIRKGSEASDERVIDLATGTELAFEVVTGVRAREQGHRTAAADTDYIRITLPRAVPANGGVRLRIDKTYKDAKSYYRDGDVIVFARSLGIKRNKVVLPPGYELVGCNVPSQILSEAHGRLAVSFINTNPEAADLIVRARPLPAGTTTLSPASSTIATRRSSTPAVASAPSTPPSLEQAAGQRIDERAVQDREIVHFLQPPATHAFDLFHDYTETRPGTGTYVNVVRPGSRVSGPSAVDLDTGDVLSVQTLTGPAIEAAKVPMTEGVRADTEAVVVRFPPVKPGHSTRLRITETYTDPARYGLVGTTLVWSRSFGRPRNALVLPPGWFPTASSMPATVSLTEDGRVRLDYVNARPDTMDVLVRASERGR